MKTARKILALVLVVALTAVFTIPVFAYGYTYYHTYNGSEVEVNAQCGGDSFSASTNTMTRTFLVKTNDKEVLLSPPATLAYQWVYGQELLVSSAVRADGVVALKYIVTYHYAGGHQIDSQVVYPSE